MKRRATPFVIALATVLSTLCAASGTRESRNAMKAWMREPLVHFLVIGALLFAFSGAISAGRPADDTIVVSETAMGRLIQLFAQQWQRPPTREELDGLVEQHVREEVLYREAIAMGLDRNDTIVRRRIVQKLEFLSQDLVDENPSESELRAFFEDNEDRFMESAIVSFEHIYLNPDDRGDAIETDAAALLDLLQAGSDPDELGDTFLLPNELQQRSQRELGGLFGTGFAAAVVGLEVGPWLGPVLSGYGHHLVRVTARTDAALPDFGIVRDKVRVEYLTVARRDADETMYQDLRAQYRIEIAAIGESESDGQ
jgi:hypothetical protein